MKLKDIIINKEYTKITTAKGIQEWLLVKGVEVEKDVTEDEKKE